MNESSRAAQGGKIDPRGVEEFGRDEDRSGVRGIEDDRRPPRGARLHDLEQGRQIAVKLESLSAPVPGIRSSGKLAILARKSGFSADSLSVILAILLGRKKRRIRLEHL